MLGSINNDSITCHCSQLSVYAVSVEERIKEIDNEDVNDNDLETGSFILVYLYTAFSGVILISLSIACVNDKKETQFIPSKSINLNLSGKSEISIQNHQDSVKFDYVGSKCLIPLDITDALEVSDISKSNIDIIMPPEPPKPTFLKKVFMRHVLFTIFVFDQQINRVKKLVIFSMLLFSHIAMIGALYQWDEFYINFEDNKTFQEVVLNYRFKDFVVLLWSIVVIIAITQILELLAKVSLIYDGIDDETFYNIYINNRIRLISFIAISLSLYCTCYYCAIIFSVDFEIGMTYLWLFNVILAYIASILIIPFFKFLLEHIASKLLMKILQKLSKFHEKLVQKHQISDLNN